MTCFGKMFGSVDDRPFDSVPFRIVTFGRNVYSGGNSLKGCVNDSLLLPQPLLSAFTEVDVRRYTDYQATVKNYKWAASQAIASLQPRATVVVIADSCFSEGITKGNPHDMFNGKPVRNRFLPNPAVPIGMPVKHQIFRSGHLRWLVISACQENQTAADAYFSDIKKYMGALSYGLRRGFEKGMTWQEWFSMAAAILYQLEFNQIPTLDGPAALKNEIIGSSQTLILHNSSHGTQLNDISGDEIDGVDEALVFDDYLPDDEIHVMLQNIPLLSN